MTTNAEVIRFLFECTALPDLTVKERLSFLGTAMRICDLDRTYGEFEDIKKIDLSEVEKGTEEQKLGVWNYYNIWDIELEIVLEYLEDNLWLTQ